MRCVGDFENLARNLRRYGVITDRTDIERNGHIITELVIKESGDTWNITMVDGQVKKILIV